MGLLRRLVTRPESSTRALKTGSSRDVGEACDEIAQIAARGMLAKALDLANRTIEQHAGPRPILAKARVLRTWGRQREALECMLKVAALGDVAPDECVDIAQACLANLRNEEALRWAEKAQALGATSVEALFVLGVALEQSRRYDEAADAYRRAVALQPDHVPSLGNLAVRLVESGEPERGEDILRRMLDLDPRNVRSHVNLAVALTRQGRYDEALRTIERCQPYAATVDDEVRAFINYPYYLEHEGHVREALQVYEDKLPGLPLVEAHFRYALLLLATGNYREGWEQYEFRFLTPMYSSARAPFRAPVWDGQDLDGKTILLRCEYGYGDTFQFIRYAPLVKALGATVVLHPTEGLFEIADSFPGIDEVVRPGQGIPPFDFHINLMSLPRVLGTTIETIPAGVPYLRIDNDLAESWRVRLGSDNRLKVGIVSSGNPAHLNDRNRSVPFALLEGLIGLPGIRWFSLQKNPPPADIERMAKCSDLVDLAGQIRNFADSAAIISQLDLVISVDTSVAHLAGALGRPVWVLLPKPAEFRWMTDGDTSPWYPTARLFRQRQAGDWTEVVERLKRSLKEWAGAPGAQRASPDRTASMPEPVAAARKRVAGLSAVRETRVGILQYFPDDEPQGRSLEWYGEWLQRELDLVLRWVRAGGVGLEACAGVGAHAIGLAEALGETGHLFLYEERPAVTRVLAQNLAANRLRNVTLMARTLGGPTGGSATDVLDDLQLERLDWLKVNAGADAQAIIAGAEATLWRTRPLLLFAAPDEAHIDDLAGHVRRFSYRCWRVETRLYDTNNFNRRTADIFDGRTALALLAIPEEHTVDLAETGCVELI